jgi:hypothetical protein
MRSPCSLCIPLYYLLNAWTNLYETWYVYHGTWAHLNGLIKQEILEITNRLLSLIRHRQHWKRRVQKFFYCCVCIRYCGNVSTEPLPSNDKGIFTETLPSNDRWFSPSLCLTTIKEIHTHTHRQQHDLISLLLFFKNKESRLKIPPTNLCVCMCIPLSLLGNGSVETLRR